MHNFSVFNFSHKFFHVCVFVFAAVFFFLIFCLPLQFIYIFLCRFSPWQRLSFFIFTIFLLYLNFTNTLHMQSINVCVKRMRFFPRHINFKFFSPTSSGSLAVCAYFSNFFLLHSLFVFFYAISSLKTLLDSILVF